MKPYPLKFKPIFKERIWGGQNLRTFFNKPLPQNTSIGESWELADLPHDKSTIAAGPAAGMTIDRLIEQNPEQITGNPDYKPPLPLLIKLLDAQDDLSVQVHPSAETCRKTGKGQPKTECWYIIDAKPDAVIYKGLKPATTRQQFRRAIQQGTTASLLNKVPVTPGQCHFLPSGTAHAIGKGLLIAEIQQPSDTTYRVFDWNRTDPATGKSRQLHIEDALQSINFDQEPASLPVTTDGLLVNAEEFKVIKNRAHKDSSQNLQKDQMQVIIIINGSGKINCPDCEPVEFSPADTILLPACCNANISFTNQGTYLTVVP